MSTTRVSLIRWFDPLDADDYQSLLVDLPEGSSRFHLAGLPRSDDWEPPPVYIENPLLPRPAIWYLSGVGGPVMTEEVVDLLEPYLSVAGELLPVRMSGTAEELFILNVVDVVDALDPARSVTEDVIELFPYFVEHRLGETGLIKVPQLLSQLFYVEHDYDEDSLRLRVERHGLTGIHFVTVWTSDAGPTLVMTQEGPIPINLILW